MEAVDKFLEAKWTYLYPGVPFYDHYIFKHICKTKDMPQQYPLNNCGIYVCINADRLALGFKHTDLNRLRIETIGRNYIMSCLYLKRVMM